METQQQILNGPGKSDFMFSLFDGKVIMFTLGDQSQIQAKITGADQEDGSFSSWLFTATDQKTMKSFSGYYHTGHRKGHMKK